MKTYDATEAAYKNGFAACAELLKKFRPGDTVSVKTDYGRREGVVTDWLIKDACQEVMYLVRVGTKEYYIAAYEADDLELVKRPFFEDEDPETYEKSVPSEMLSTPPIPFVGFQDDVTDGPLYLRADTITAVRDGIVVTNDGTWCVKETADEIVKRVWDIQAAATEAFR